VAILADKGQEILKKSSTFPKYFGSAEEKILRFRKHRLGKRPYFVTLPV